MTALGARLGTAGRDSLQFAGIELLDSATYHVMDGKRGFGDPQIVVEKIRSQLSVGSFVTGDATDNRTITLQVLITASSRAQLAEADSALRFAVNASGVKTLVWTPYATGLPLVFEVWRGQVNTVWSKKWEAQGCRVVTITMDALPFGRSDVKQSVSGSSSSLQIGDFTANPEYTYHVPDGTAQAVPDGSNATVATAGTAYAPQATPAPVDGASCMRIDFGKFYSTRSLIYVNVAEIDTVTASLDLSTYPTIELLYSFNGAFVQSNSVYFDLTLTDTSSRTVTVQTRQVATQSGNAWKPIFWSADDFSALDLKNVASWKLRVWTQQTSLTSVWLGLLRAYPAISSQASTTHGAVYKLAGVVGDARADATLAFDRGGTNTITGFLAYRAPRDTPPTTPCLVALTGSAPSTGSTTAPSTFNGTYRVILANAGGSNIAASGVLTVTQKVGGTTVATATVSTATVAGGSKWADCGDLTLPLIDVPSEATDVTYDFSFAATATEVILADTRGFLAWVPTTAAVKYCWVDEATAQRAGGVYGGDASDRSDATSLLALSGAQPSGTPSLQPGDNYVLVYVVDGAPSNVTVTYYDRWLGDRVPSFSQQVGEDLFTDTFLDVF